MQKIPRTVRDQSLSLEKNKSRNPIIYNFESTINAKRRTLDLGARPFKTSKDIKNHLTKFTLKVLNFDANQDNKNEEQQDKKAANDLNFAKPLYAQTQRKKKKTNRLNRTMDT